MSTYSVYRVSGSRAYRGHQPGERFTARLQPGPEHRALMRGDIEVLDRLVPALPPDYRLPPGWADRSSTPEAPQSVSSIEGGR